LPVGSEEFNAFREELSFKKYLVNKPGDFKQVELLRTGVVYSTVISYYFRYRVLGEFGKRYRAEQCKEFCTELFMQSSTVVVFLKNKPFIKIM
jgi:hypothetical protein